MISALLATTSSRSIAPRLAMRLTLALTLVLALATLGSSFCIHWRRELHVAKVSVFLGTASSGQARPCSSFPAHGFYLQTLNNAQGSQAVPFSILQDKLLPKASSSSFPFSLKRASGGEAQAPFATEEVSGLDPGGSGTVCPQVDTQNLSSQLGAPLCAAKVFAVAP
mmetsp:Transcript_16831/g.32843  ORF Transcript_16831/g.32843 Transcript_16831/m.32843 type:complete len:167 (-) Transcript_16831:63-563(-)